MAIKAASPKQVTPPQGEVSFVRVGQTAARRRLVVLVQGPPKTGKSHFALTAPGPIYYQSMDPGDEIVEAKDKPWSGKEIYLANYNPDLQIEDEQQRAVIAEKYWGMWLANQRKAVHEGRTTIIDTETDTWELFRLARTGRANPEKQAYMVISPEYRSALRSYYESDCNLILLAKLGDEYKNNKSTGNQKRKGFADAGYLAQVIVETWKTGKEYGLTVLDCRMNPDLEGMPIPGCDFSTLAQMVYPDSQTEDWE